MQLLVASYINVCFGFFDECSLNREIILQNILNWMQSEPEHNKLNVKLLPKWVFTSAIRTVSEMVQICRY